MALDWQSLETRIADILMQMLGPMETHVHCGIDGNAAQEKRVV